MFLMKLMHIISLKPEKSDLKKKEIQPSIENEIKKNESNNLKIDPINQIKNISQEKKSKPEIQTDIKSNQKNLISSFEELLKICGEKKEMKLKYELEKNVNLVSFENKRIEISFNEDLHKDFIKDLSTKLFEWTSQRWIITFSKTKGQISVKDRQINKKTELINLIKKSQIYNDVLEAFPDANLIDVISDKKKDDE